MEVAALKIERIHSSSIKNNSLSHNEKQIVDQYKNDEVGLQNSLDYLAIINKSSMNSVSFKGSLGMSQPYFEINLPLKDLIERTSSESLTDFKMLDSNSEAYKNLADGDKKALKHLVKAARILDDVYLKQDNSHNLEFKEFLKKEAARGNMLAIYTLKLFNAQKGINAKDVNGNIINLAKDCDVMPGKGFYPEDLSKEEFHSILKKMIKDGEVKEVSNILNQRSIVERDGDKLKAIDYTDYFKDEFMAAADELIEAARTSTDEDFNKFLLLQADALMTNNPQVDAEADKIWAGMQYTPLEFTISRECYDDRMTPTVTEDSELMRLLEKNHISFNAKDTFGVRVGIVNKAGTEYLLSIKDYLPLMAENMPYNDEYEQNFLSSKNDKQKMVDVDIVEMTGQKGAYRGGVAIASNLPNNDKLAVKQGGGHRNVYHRQMREAKYKDNFQQKLDLLLDESQHKYFDVDALHDFTILHENIHSLGPKNGLEKLGVLKNTIEEYKADTGSLTMLDPLVQAGFYTPERAKKIITSLLVGYVQKGPDFEDAHRRRNIMQYNYLIENGAIEVNDKGKMKINFEKVVPTAKKMLADAVRIQLDGDSKEAQDYVDRYCVWTKELDLMAKNLNGVDKKLNSQIVTPLADKLVAD